MKRLSLTTMALAIVTIAELYFTKSMGDSVFLWLLYGVYKVMT